MKVKITKHGKKRDDKDELENILVFVCLFVCFLKFLRVNILAQKGDSGPGPPLNPPIFANSVYHNVLFIYYWYLQYSRNAMCVLN